ncbi:MAG: methionyl-tRNA formyltransferase [Eubacteriales bacterium]|nr:methionyl-tRNA formyltransferase [Eubacteriales bacterium]
MRIIYMGTPDFAVPALQHLYEKGYQISLVVTQPDKPRDRGKKIQPTPVKVLAEDLGISVMQPNQIKENDDFLDHIAALNPDLIVVVAYGKMLPNRLLSIPRFGCVNIHGSLLPKYRGAAPIQHAILAGDERTGVTLMYMSEGMDKGDIIATDSTPIGDKTAGELHEELAVMGADLLVGTVPFIEAGTAMRIKQDDTLASYAPMIKKQDGLVDFNRTPEEIRRQIRAMNPWPGAYTYYKGKPLKLFEAKDGSESNPEGLLPGTIIFSKTEGIGVQTGKGILLVTRIQMPGKRIMDVSEFLKGNQIEIYQVLG